MKVILNHLLYGEKSLMTIRCNKSCNNGKHHIGMIFFELNVDLDDYFIFTFKQAISDKIITGFQISFKEFNGENASRSTAFSRKK